MSPFDLESFRANRNGNTQTKKSPPRHKAGEWFLKGPIPGKWLHRAAKLPGRALHAGLALWFLAGLKKTNHVVLTWAGMSRFGLSPHSGRRGLDALEQDGLVQVDRHRGRSPRVTILEVDDRHKGEPPKTQPEDSLSSP